MSPRALPSADYLDQCFEYDQETGELRWKERPVSHFPTKRAAAIWNGRFAGKLAGCANADGYRIVGVGTINWLAHRLIWKLMTGDDGPESVDHRNGDTGDNRWCNLRAATKTEQAWNAVPPKNSRTGRRGVSPHRRKWGARIAMNGMVRWLGVYATVEEASAAYNAAARELHGEFYRPT
jgi:hypothetical protein